MLKVTITGDLGAGKSTLAAVIKKACVKAGYAVDVDPGPYTGVDERAIVGGYAKGLEGLKRFKSRKVLIDSATS